ncbi:hypothetical protein ACTWP4_02405 [Gracilibacillus sp. D59]|uniref:hypothetical protein n=1 Tax=Gracilibacillus sp. D59 TaxID=3457434 RepID=UPI003FCC314D
MVSAVTYFNDVALVASQEKRESNKNPKEQSNQFGSYPAYPELASEIQQECFKRGLILEVGGRYSTIIHLLPFFIITKEQTDDVLQRFYDLINTAEVYFGL